jgi:hypothetical protein
MKKFLLAMALVVFGASLAHAESLSDMPPVGTYIGFPGRHIPRLLVGTDGFAISSHIASCVTIKSTLKPDKDTHVVSLMPDVPLTATLGFLTRSGVCFQRMAKRISRPPQQQAKANRSLNFGSRS